MWNDMPPAVDPDSGLFIPPPPGATQGGQPIAYAPFPGTTPPVSPWAANWSAPAHASAWLPQQQHLHPPPSSAHSWAYGQSTPYNAPTPAGSWGAATPAGSYGPPTPASVNGYPPLTAAYSPWPTEQTHPIIVGGTPAVPDAMLGQPMNASPWVNGFGPPLSAGNSPHPSRKKTKSKRNSTFPHPSDAGALVLQRTMSHEYPLGGGFGFQLQRSLSSGGGSKAYPPFTGYQQPIEEYSAKNLARRPREWRPDYDAREGLASYIPRVIKPSSDVREWSDPQKRTPHEYLAYKPSNPAIFFDLRSNPLDPLNPGLQLSRAHRRLNTVDFAQLATTPAAQVMRLFHPSLPWYIDIFQSHPSGITVHDVLWQLFTQLDVQILGKDWYNECLNDADRARMAECFQERVEGREDEMRRGIKRVDFLRGKVVFEGLARTRSGMWEIKTRRYE